MGITTPGSNSNGGGSFATLSGTYDQNTSLNTKIVAMDAATAAKQSAFTGQTANTIYTGPLSGSAATPTFRSLDRRDLNNLYTEIGTVFTENWTNLASWSNVGTPNASVSGGQLTLSGTASQTTNYIKNNSYGNFNMERVDYVWTETVGTVGASTNGPIFSMLSNNLSNTASIDVTLDLSTGGNAGRILWYSNNTTLMQTSSNTLAVVLGNVLTFRLSVFPDRYELTVTNTGGTSIFDSYFFFGGPGFVYLPAASVNWAFKNNGNGATPHTIGPLTVTPRSKKNVDYLFVGDSITHGYSCYNFYNRYITQLQKNYNVNIEVNAQSGVRCADMNLTEMASYNPTKIVLFIGTNDVAAVGAGPAFTALQSLITSLGTTLTTAAPSGYSIANNNLYICTIPPRNTAATATFNSSIKSTYSLSNIIDVYALATDGSNTIPTKYSFDVLHPNDVYHRLIADKIATFLSLTSRDIFRDYYLVNPSGVSSWLTNNMSAVSKSTATYLGMGTHFDAPGSNIYASSVDGFFLAHDLGSHKMSFYYNTGLTVGSSYGATERWFFNTTGITLSEAYNLVVGTTTGTKIGTATSQKLGFWNATPVIQPTTGISGAAITANSGTAVNDASTFAGYTVGQIVAALRQIGVLA